MKKKVKLDDLKVSSFVTAKGSLLGGASEIVTETVESVNSYCPITVNCQ